MSDYIFMLENHLSPDQNRVVAEVQAAAGLQNLNVFLTGGAMRDMLGGFPIRDLDFSVEGNALKVARAVAEKTGAESTVVDEARRSVELVFSSGVTAQISMSRQEKYGRPGTRPTITPATIQEDLRRRDFTINAIALSLNKASRGLLLDPMNGLADLEHHELRLVGTYGFYEDPVRLLRLLRFAARFGFGIDERTRQQFENAREAGVEKQITPRALADELLHIAAEDAAAEVVAALDGTGLLALYLPGWTGAKAPGAGLEKFSKAVRILPDSSEARAARFGPFMVAFTANLSPKERQALAKNIELTKPELDRWLKLEARAKKLEAAIKAPKIRKPSHVYRVLVKAAYDEVLYLLYHSTAKPVQERIRNYYQKFLPLVQELPEAEFAGIEAKPGTPKYEKAREEAICKALDRKPKKPEPEEVAPEPPVVEEAPVRGRPGR